MATVIARLRQNLQALGQSLLGVVQNLAIRLFPLTSRLPPLPGGLKLWISLLSFGFVLAALVAHGRELLRLSLDLQGWLWLALGLGISLLSLVVNGLAWGVVLRWLGRALPLQPLLELFLRTNLRKYLPGGIWHLASRVQVLRRGGEPFGAPLAAGEALLGTLLDPLLMAVAALLLVPFGGWQRGLALLALTPLLLLVPARLAPLLQRLEQRRSRQLGLEQELAGAPGQAVPLPVLRGYPLLPLGAELAFVLVRFAGFACCVQAFDLHYPLGWPGWLAGFALAWTVGLVVPGAPGGLGVFEAMLLLRLAAAVPEAPLLAVALSYRLVTTLADLLVVALVQLDRSLENLILRNRNYC
ncbi:MAG: lysylphosphatidylglycerol synthase domain-containing protein [Prochlorococcaceae cyanobacterium]